jgi:2'-5' RNA ligase
MPRLYFIAVIPHEELQKEVTELKKYMAAHFDAKAALSSPPHITLYPPFRENIEKEKHILKSLEDFSENQKPFNVILNGFGCFRPRTIFIKPEENLLLNTMETDLLNHLKTTINLYDPQNDRPYHPHMTIATRDLKKEEFFKAWEIFKEKEFKRVFSVDRPHLLRHNGKTWDVLS